MARFGVSSPGVVQRFWHSIIQLTMMSALLAAACHTQPQAESTAIGGGPLTFVSVMDVKFRRALTESVLWHDKQRLWRINQQGQYDYGPLAGVEALTLDNLDLHLNRETRFLGAELDEDWDTSWPKNRYCIWIRVENGKYKARTTLFSGNNCPTPTAETDWYIYESTQTFRKRDIPATARWELDKTGKPYIGFKCDKKWCAVAPYPIDPSPTYESATKNHQKIKGYYDEQILSLSDRVPTPLHATLFPTEDLDDDFDDFDAKKVVAKIVLRAVNGAAQQQVEDARKHYQTKWGMSEIPRLNDTIYVRLFLRNEHGPNSGTAYFEHAGSAAMGIPVHRLKDGKPGTEYKLKIREIARWGYHATDESVWLRCGDGCCESSQTPSERYNLLFRMHSK
jgi:hypothetical protein